MTTSRSLRLLAAIAFASLLASQATAAADLVPYRARYALTLATTKVASSGVVDAGGAVRDEFNQTCDGWTEQEHFYLHLDYGDGDSEHDTFDTYSNLVTWEARNGLRFRFDMRRASTDQPYEEISGDARLGGPGGAGKAAFTRPRAVTLPLAPGTLFPSAHTRLLIERAQAGDQFVTRNVFDGSEVESAGQITAVIGLKHVPGAGDDDEKLPDSPLLNRPYWPIRLAFFSADRTDETPDYEESLLLLDDGVIQDMVIDYGDYSIRAKLEQIEALPRPHC